MFFNLFQIFLYIATLAFSFEHSIQPNHEKFCNSPIKYLISKIDPSGDLFIYDVA